jgi:V8-like Glu-specific endopeptidase
MRCSFSRVRPITRQGHKPFGLLTIGAAMTLLSIATAPPASADEVSGGPVEVVATNDTAAVEYWTPQRMTNAVAPDLELPNDDRPPSPDRADIARGAPVRVAPSREPSTPALLPLATSATRVRKPYTNLPDRTVGKVFFTDSTGRDHTCSGVVLNSTNKSVVWTAGHCVELGRNGGFHTNWVFVPGLGSCAGGCRPYATYRATKLLTTTGWAQDGDHRVDIGAAIVAPIDGRRIVQAVGGQGFAAGQDLTTPMLAVGYPADPPFDGWRQWMCAGPTVGRDDTISGDGPDPFSIACDMTGGASGGPWLIDLGTNGYGYLNGSTAYRYLRDPTTMYSPYYGEEAAALYAQASTTSVFGP